MSFLRKLRITVGNKSYDVTVEDLTEGDAYTDVRRHASPHLPSIPSPAPPPANATRSPAPASPAAEPGSGAVTSPMAGAIKSILVDVGATVTSGQPLIVLEAMKMENQITAPTAGTVQSLAVKEGDSVQEAQVLLVLE